MSYKTRSQIDQINFIRQIKQYTINLQDLLMKLLSLSNHCRHMKHSQASINQIQNMTIKIQLQLNKYQQMIEKIQNKIMTKGGIQNLKMYITNNYNLLVKEAYQLMSMCGNTIKLPTENDLKKLKTFQEELETQWEQIKNNSLNCQLQRLKTINNNGYEEKINKNNLKQMANAQIQQQFLAIRMVAYKLYEKYNEHSHPKLYDQLGILKEEQSKLAKEITEMKDIRMKLLDEERRLQKQLTEVKRINELVGRRYFVQDSRIETNFTTN